MAVIKRNEEQERALQEVNELLKKLETVNEAVSCVADGKGISVSIEGKRSSIAVNTDKGRKNIKSALVGEQITLRKNIEATAKKYNLALSREDETILNWQGEGEDDDTPLLPLSD